MRKALVVASALLFVSVAGRAQTPGQASLTPETLAAIFGPADSGSCAEQQTGMLFAATRKGPPIRVNSACTATAHCQTGTVSCQGNNTCTAVDSTCSAGEQGYVTCDGNTTWCPVCVCTGTFQQRECCICGQTSDCFACCICGGGGRGQCAYQCG
jgi:hypothetical protein